MPWKKLAQFNVYIYTVGIQSDNHRNVIPAIFHQEFQVPTMKVLNLVYGYFVGRFSVTKKTYPYSLYR